MDYIEIRTLGKRFTMPMKEFRAWRKRLGIKYRLEKGFLMLESPRQPGKKVKFRSAVYKDGMFLFIGK